MFRQSPEPMNHLIVRKDPVRQVRKKANNIK